MHDQFQIPIEDELLKKLTAEWGPVAYIFLFPELNLIRVGDSRSIVDRIKTHRGTVPGPIRLLRVARGGKAQATEWEKYLNGAFKTDSGGSWYMNNFDTQSFLRKIPQENEEMIIDRLIELEIERHADAMRTLQGEH